MALAALTLTAKGLGCCCSRHGPDARRSPHVTPQGGSGVIRRPRSWKVQMKKQQLEAGKHWHEHPGHGPRTTVGLGKSIPEPAELWEPETVPSGPSLLYDRSHA